MIDSIVLIGSFIGLLALGVPVAFSIGLSTAVAMLLSIPPGPALATMAQRIATGLDSFALQAIPFFLLAGQLMNRGGSATRLIAFARSLLGHADEFVAPSPLEDGDEHAVGGADRQQVEDCGLERHDRRAEDASEQEERQHDHRGDEPGQP